MSIAFYAIFSLFILKWLWDEEKKDEIIYLPESSFVMQVSMEFDGKWPMACSLIFYTRYPASVPLAAFT